MEPAALLENGNETHLCYSVPTLPERLLSALSNLKSVLKSFSVIFKPQNFLKLFSLFINFLKLLYPDFLIKVLLILSLPILALFIFFCYLYHRSITGVGLGCRFHLPRPANSIKNYNQIDSGFRLLEGTIFISLWDGGPFDRDAMEQNLVVKSSRVMRGNDLKTKLGPGGNTKIRIFDAGFIASFKRVVSKPLSSARLIAEALRNGVSWRLKVLHITWTRVKEAVCSSVESRLEALCTGIKSILKAFFTGATRYLITLIVDSLLQAYLSLRLLQALCIWTYKEQNITLRWYVEGWCAAFGSIRKIISTRYGDLALRPRITRKYIQCRRKIGRKLASASSSLRSIINSTIWIITLCYQNRTAIIMFLPTCIGMLLLWGMQASKHMGRFLLFDRVGQFIASLLVVMIGLLIWYRINPLNWFQLPGPQSYVDTRKFRPKASMEFLRPPRRRENRVRNER